MPDCAILSIGRELMLGFTVDTNAAWLAGEISAIGYKMKTIRLIDDELEAIVSAVRELSVSSDLLVITGGLGPTPDDLTREAVAKAAGEELVYYPELYEKIEERFKHIGITISESNRLQAWLPKSAAALPNTCGTAPGIDCVINNCHVYVMPGVPREMEAMFRLSVLPQITLAASGHVRFMKRLQVSGIGESRIGEMIKTVSSHYPDCEIGTTVHTGVVTVRTMAFAPELEVARALVEPAAGALRQMLGVNVYGEDGQTLAEVVTALLTEKKQTLALAESCTGGWIAGEIVNVPGASEVLLEGVVSYSNEAKCRRLGVKEQTLAQHGAVSCETVAEMACGARAASGADYALSISGVAGPGGGSAEKPVGTTWIAIACDKGIFTLKRNFIYNREGNRRLGVNISLDLLRRVIAGLPLLEGAQICPDATR